MYKKNYKTMAGMQLFRPRNRITKAVIKDELQLFCQYFTQKNWVELSFWHGFRLIFNVLLRIAFHSPMPLTNKKRHRYL
jgi:hypothetical protein